MRHEYLEFEDSLKKYYESVKQKNEILQYQILYTNKGTGLAEIFKNDYKNACQVKSGTIFAMRIWISYLYTYLPSPNRKWTKEESKLIKNLVTYTLNDINPDYEFLDTHIKQVYKEMIRTIIDSKTLLINATIENKSKLKVFIS